MRYAAVAFVFALMGVVGCDDGATDATLPEGTAPARELEPQERPDEPIALPGEEQAEASAAPERASTGSLTYDLPEGWTVGPARTMRELTLIAPPELGGAELAVARWPAGVGTYHANVIRWAQQVGMTAEDAAKIDGLDLIDIDGVESRWQPLVNEAGDKALLTVWVPRGADEIWTIKFPANPGSVQQVQAAEATVRAFVESIDFE